MNGQSNGWRRVGQLLIIAVWMLVLAALISPVLWSAYVFLTTGNWPAWSGFGDYVGPLPQAGQQIQRGKTMWDWMELLIIPLGLVGVAYLLNRLERRTEHQYRLARERATFDRDLALERQRDEALQTYLDHMTDLLLEASLRESKEGTEVQHVARVRTLTVLRGLDGNRRTTILRFLHEAGLLAACRRETEKFVFSAIWLRRAEPFSAEKVVSPTTC
jgi:hypothetical protein